MLRQSRLVGEYGLGCCGWVGGGVERVDHEDAGAEPRRPLSDW